jgi:hypothetical protein
VSFSFPKPSISFFTAELNAQLVDTFSIPKTSYLPDKKGGALAPPKIEIWSNINSEWLTPF